MSSQEPTGICRERQTPSGLPSSCNRVMNKDSMALTDSLQILGASRFASICRVQPLGLGLLLPPLD